MTLRFGLPEENRPGTAIPSKRMVAPLRAEGNLSYREFISLVKQIWEEIHPDIPIKPVQDSSYAAYPVIIYSLENRKTMSPEPKQRYREEVVLEGDHNVVVTGQRFQNYIAFSAITENEPELSEAIIEEFEDFIQEYTPVFKRAGLSDIFYSRRLSDREETRDAGDASVRTVAYMCVIEKITTIPVSKIEKVLANVSVKTTSIEDLLSEDATPDWEEDLEKATPDDWFEIDIDDSIDGATPNSE